MRNARLWPLLSWLLPTAGGMLQPAALLIAIAVATACGYAQEQASPTVEEPCTMSVVTPTEREQLLSAPVLPQADAVACSAAEPDTSSFALIRAGMSEPARVSLYKLPYSRTVEQRNWGRLWVNTAIFAGAYIGTLAILECLPEGATNWNRENITSKPWYKRWEQNVLHKGPEWDGDSYVFNYILHPYAGAVYFMAARTAGFNFYRSLLYCTLVSTVGWEFGIEGCMERPSIQDIFITPLVGSVIGELFYYAKRHIVAHGYCLLGSRFLGELVCFLVDPVNEIVDLVSGTRNRQTTTGKQDDVTSSLSPVATPSGIAFAFRCTF